MFEPKPRQCPIFRNPSSLHLKKLAEIEEMNEWGRERIGRLSEDTFLAAGAALDAGEVIEESRLRVQLHLHEGLDVEAAEKHWSEVTAIGCCYVSYGCSRTHRRIMGLTRALLSSQAPSGVAQLAERLAVNQDVESSSLSPGATKKRQSKR